jgi:LmbE family N-acetylglucosaminyl deacetylase
MAERVLVLAPHPDDEAIGCGGAICLHRRRGDPVRVAFLTSGEQGLPDLPAEDARWVRETEAEAAGAVLGVERLDFLRLPDLGLADNLEEGAARLAPLLAAAPDLVYLPHPGEPHPDHEAVLPMVRLALAGLPAGAPLPELRGYEVWGPMTRFGWVELIGAVMGQKLRAVRCYRSQLRQFRYDRAVAGLNRYRGALGAGARYAEAFVYLGPAPPTGPEPTGQEGPPCSTT